MTSTVSPNDLSPRSWGVVPLTCLAYALMLLFVILLLIAWQPSKNAYYVLCLAGIALLLARRVDFRLSAEEGVFFGVVIFYVAVAVCAYFANELSEKHWQIVGSRYGKLLLMLPMFYLLRFVQLSEQAVYRLFALGIAVAGVTALLQVDGGGGAERASGNDQAIVFGATALAMTWIASSGLFQEIEQRRWIWWLQAAAVAGGFYAVLMSGSRGVWLAVVPAAATYLFYLWPRIGAYTRVGALLAMVALLAAAYHVPRIHGRFELAITNVERYLESAPGEVGFSSVGERLEMWRAAWALFKQRPLIGHGPNTFRERAPDIATDLNLNPSTLEYGHVHNQFLEVLYSRGVLGLVALFLVWGVPLYLFYRRARRRSGPAARLGLAGMLFVLSFWVYGLTYAPFERKSQLTFYSFTVALLYSVIRQHEQTATPRRT